MSEALGLIAKVPGVRYHRMFTDAKYELAAAHCLMEMLHVSRVSGRAIFWGFHLVLGSRIFI